MQNAKCKIKKIKKILIRCPNWIGDVMLSLPAISVVREVFPSINISALIKSSLSPLIEGNPDINEIISFSPETMSVYERLKFYRGLKDKNFDSAILLTNSFESALSVYLGGIKNRIGYNSDMRRIFLTESIPVPSRKYPRVHQADFYLTLIKAISEARSQKPEARSKNVSFYIPEDIQNSIDKFWEEKGLSIKSPVIGMNIGAFYGSAKRWLPERFAEVGDTIYEKLRGEVIIFGSQEEKAVENEIRGKMRYNPISMVGKTTMKSLAAMIKRCHLFITNDSGPMHIAAAVGTPIVAIFGSTDPSETSPLCSNYKIVRKPVDCSPCWKRECPTDHKCMKLIEVSDVMDAVKAMLTI
ncbi:MAG: lipopolysaccharide heptosyltransferase II [Nitrospinae bacterium RIFCSPLOWO2_02_FULL_39_110]|nr:MAG: lipopolysaccharide heptosyltransferase II [Nitrospinae bacterium RIFCSPLOWO2_02_FULL_39_110]